VERDMAEGIDPYKKWLGIPPKHQPPHHYRLLGLELYESDPDVIDNAAERQMTHVRKYQTGKHVDLSQKLLNEIASARICLLNPAKKAQYDENLKVRLQKESSDALPVAEAIFDDDAAVSAPGKPAVAKPLPPRRPPYRPVPHVSGAASSAAAVSPVKIASGAAASGATAPAVSSGVAGRKTSGPKGGFPHWIPLVVGGAGLATVLLVVGVVLAVSGVFSGDDDERDRVARKSTRTTSNSKPVRPDEKDPSKPPYGKQHDPSGKRPDKGTPRNGDPGSTGNFGLPPEKPVKPDVTITPPPHRPVEPPRRPVEPPRRPVEPPRRPVEPYRPSIRSAYVYVTGECSDGWLRKGERAVADPVMVFAELGRELQHHRFTRFNRGGVTDVAAEVRSPGTVFLIVRPEFTSQLEESSKLPELRKTSISCEIQDGQGKRIQYDVLAGNFSRGRKVEVSLQTDSPGDLPFLLASRSMSVRRLPAYRPLPGTTPVEPKPPVKLAAIPSTEEQTKIESEVNEIFNTDQANTPVEQLKIAQTLIAEGTKTSDNPSEAFVMLRMGHELAAGVGDLKTAFAAIDRINGRFADADVAGMRIHCVSLASKARLPAAQKRVFLKQALPVIDQALAAGKYEKVGKVTDALLATARPLKDARLTRALVDRRKQITEALKVYKKVEPALNALKANPEDPDANETAGTYYCFVREEWDTGLPMLAKAADAKLKQLAAADLAKPDEADEQLKVAKGWYKLSKDKSGSEKVALLGRAEHWYVQSVPKLTGLNKVQGEKHLAEIRETIEAAGGSKRVVWPRKATIVAAADYRFDMYVNGQHLTGGSYSSVYRKEGMFNKGDVIVVRATRSRSSSRGPRQAFACAIKFEDSSRYLATGAPGSGWMTFQPSSTSYWYKPDQGRVVGPAVASVGTAPQRILQETGLQCGAIWGSVDSAPSSSYGTTYLILQVK